MLPQAYQDLLEVAADAGRPLRAAEFAAAAGLAHGQGEGGGPAVEAEAAGRAGLAGRGARRPVHAARITVREKHRNPDGNGFFFLGSKVLLHPDLKEEEPSWKRTAAVPPDDPFAASKDMFGGLAAELAGPAAAGLTAFQLEELVDERGREVLRQLLQDHFDLRAAREEQQARERRAPVTGTDGITRTRLETGHGRLLATLFGTVRVTRCAWRKPGSGELLPGRRRPVAAGRAAFPFPGEAGRHRGGPRLVRCRARRGRPPLRAGDGQAAGRGGRRATPPPISPRSTPPGFRSRARPSTLLVLSADCKGIVMRPGALRAATARAAARLGKMRTRLSAGEKPNRKRMADARHRLRRRAGDAPPARRDRPARRPARCP